MSDNDQNLLKCRIEGSMTQESTDDQNRQCSHNNASRDRSGFNFMLTPYCIQCVYIDDQMWECFLSHQIIQRAIPTKMTNDMFVSDHGHDGVQVERTVFE